MNPTTLSAQEFAAKYGAPVLSVPNAPVKAAPAPTAAVQPPPPITISADQFKTKYGSLPPSSQVNDSSVPAPVDNTITPGTSTLAKAANAFVPIGADIGQGLAESKNKDLYNQALTQYQGTQQRLQAAIAADQAAGKDTTRLQGALDTLNKTAPNEEDFTGTQKSAEQIAGDAISSGLNIAGAVDLAGLVPGAAILGSGAEAGAEAAAPAVAKTTGQKLFQGAVTGAKYGAVAGGANALQNNDSTGGVVGGTLKGAGVGALTGAAVEGVASKLPKPSILQTPTEKAANAFDESLSNAEQSIYPKATAAELKTMKLKDTGSLFGDKTVPDFQSDARSKPIINSVANLPEDIQLKPSMTVAQKESNLQQGISRLHQATADNLAQPEVKAATTFQPTAYDQFMQEHILKPVADEYGVDSMQYKNAQKGVEISKNSITENNALGVHEGRQNFDKDFKANNKQAFKQKGTLFGQLDPHVTNVVETGRNIRTAMNDFTESLLPENHPFRANLREESNLLNGLSEMRKRSVSQIGKNSFSRALDRNPTLKKTLQMAASATRTGAAVDLLHHL